MRKNNITGFTNLHQIGAGLHNFLANNHGYPVVAADLNSENPGPWYCQIEATGFGNSNPDYFAIFKTSGPWHCPSARWKNSGQNASYWFNSDGIARGSFLGLGGRPVQSGKTLSFNPIGESEVISPADMMAIGDSFTGSQGMERKDIHTLEIVVGNVRARHQGKANELFCDGHVGSPKLEFLFEDTSDAAFSRWNRDHQPHREKL
jgi:prepilin-type processing-associated H-X9-DG protein